MHLNTSRSARFNQTLRKVKHRQSRQKKAALTQEVALNQVDDTDRFCSVVLVIVGICLLLFFALPFYYGFSIAAINQ